jgi:hypothetical protein
MGAAGIFGLDPYARVDASDAERVQRIPLDSILPDATQPRMLLPRDLHTGMHSGHMRPPEVLQELERQATGDPEAAGIMQRITELAGNIAAVGLINPITVFKTEAGKGLTDYTIESGERRWWAHWQLVRRGNVEFQYVRCLVVPARDLRLRRLAENLQREDLTAVETAIGLAGLVLEVEGEPFPQPGPDEFVPSGLRELMAHRLKKGTWGAVEQATGYSMHRWVRYLWLFRLCDEALRLAQAQRLTERALRPFVQIEDPVDQVAAIQSLVVGQSDEEEDAAGHAEHENRSGTAASPAAPPARPTWWRKLQRVRRELTWRDDQELAERRTVFDSEPGRRVLTDLRDQIDLLLATLQEQKQAADQQLIESQG